MGPPIAVEDFVEAWATAVCDAVEPCCLASKYGWSREGCLLHMRNEAKLHVTGADLPGVIWDAQTAGNCIAGIRRDLSGCHHPINLDLYDTCLAHPIGTKAPGENCTHSFQCAAPAHSMGLCTPLRTDGGTDNRQVCTVLPSYSERGKLGDPCWMDCKRHDLDFVTCSGPLNPTAIPGAPDAPWAARCFENDGLYCNQTTFRCTARVPLGADCRKSAECAVGLFCQSGKCAPGLPLGAACTRSDLCAPGSYCDDASGVCTEGLPDGSRCEINWHCRSGWCGAVDDPTTRVCTPMPLWGTANPWQCGGTLDGFVSDAGSTTD